jgi:hypothetical protein
MKISKKKKRLLLIVVPLVLLLAIAGSVLFFGGSANAEVGNLQVFKGSANVVRGSNTVVGATGTPIEVSDHIKVPNGSTVAIILKDNTIIRLEGGSDVEVAELSYQGGKIKDAVFKLTNGRLWSRVQTVQNGSKFDVETPTITAAVRGTSFNTTFKNNISGIYVYHHVVNVTLQQTGGQQTVTHGQLLQMHQDTLKDDFNKGPVTPPENYIDDWIKFNQAQDDKLCRELHDLPDCDEATNTNTNNPPATQQEQTPTQTPPPTTTTTPKPPPPPPPPVTLTQVTVSCAFTDYDPPNSNPDPCTAAAKYSDGTTKDVTALTATVWTDSPAAGGFQLNGAYMDYYAAYVTGDHLVTVKATYGGKTGSIVIDTNGLG